MRLPTRSGSGSRPTGLTRLLKPYGIPTDAFVHDESGKSHRGWKREHFEDAWARYLRENRANRADGSTAPFTGADEACAHAPTHACADLARPHGYAVRTVRTVSKALPGDNGFRDYLNHAHAAGCLTERERFERRLLHNLIVCAGNRDESESA
jgi:hypothetical protein